MKKLVYLIILSGCNQQYKIPSISYDIEVIKRKYIEINISNNTDKDYFFVTPKLYFIKNSNNNKSILTEDIITEIDYNYEDFLVSKKHNHNILTSIDSIKNNCNSIFLILKKSESIKLMYKIKNYNNLSGGDYSVIVNHLNCNIDYIKKKNRIGYLPYKNSLLIPTKINIE